MSKYIIELDDRIKLVTSVGVTENGVVYTTSDYVHNLEELNSDYINEHFGDLQDEAYRQGSEELRNVLIEILEADTDTRKKYLDYIGIIDILVHHSASKIIEKWQARKKDDEINVGDEVADKDGDKTIVTNIHGDLFDGLCSDGSTMTDLFLCDNHKTGRHFDIESILEDMRE